MCLTNNIGFTTEPPSKILHKNVNLLCIGRAAYYLWFQYKLSLIRDT